jgi:hypothetical protein
MPPCGRIVSTAGYDVGMADFIHADLHGSRLSALTSAARGSAPST